MIFATELLPERKCHTCTLGQKERWGCTKDAPGAPLVIDGVESRRCPNRPFLDDPLFYSEIFRLSGWVKKGFLPEPGGVLDQANCLVECLEIIEDAHYAAQKAKEEKMERIRDLMAKK